MDYKNQKEVRAHFGQKSARQTAERYDAILNKRMLENSLNPEAQQEMKKHLSEIMVDMMNDQRVIQQARMEEAIKYLEDYRPVNNLIIEKL